MHPSNSVEIILITYQKKKKIFWCVVSEKQIISNKGVKMIDSRKMMEHWMPHSAFLFFFSFFLFPKKSEFLFENTHSCITLSDKPRDVSRERGTSFLTFSFIFLFPLWFVCMRITRVKLWWHHNSRELMIAFRQLVLVQLLRPFF